MFENALEASVITKTFCFDNNIIRIEVPFVHLAKTKNWVASHIWNYTRASGENESKTRRQVPSMAPAFLLYDKGKYENTNFPKKILKTTNFLPAELL